MNKYSLRGQVMHAITAVMVFCLLLVGMCLSKVPENYQGVTYMLHKSFGITVFFLTLFRIYFIIKDGRPAYPPHVSKLEAWFARGVQLNLYFFLIAMPLSGWLMSVASNHIPEYFGLFQLNIPGVPHTKAFTTWMVNSHYWMAWSFAGYIVLHLCGNIKHYFFDKDKVVQSMWNFKK